LLGKWRCPAIEIAMSWAKSCWIWHVVSTSLVNPWFVEIVAGHVDFLNLFAYTFLWLAGQRILSYLHSATTAASWIECCRREWKKNTFQLYPITQLLYLLYLLYFLYSFIPSFIHYLFESIWSKGMRCGNVTGLWVLSPRWRQQSRRCQRGGWQLWHEEFSELGCLSQEV
jgi:hypothetical protein